MFSVEPASRLGAYYYFYYSSMHVSQPHIIRLQCQPDFPVLIPSSHYNSESIADDLHDFQEQRDYEELFRSC